MVDRGIALEFEQFEPRGDVFDHDAIVRSVNDDIRKRHERIMARFVGEIAKFRRRSIGSDLEERFIGRQDANRAIDIAHEFNDIATAFAFDTDRGDLVGFRLDNDRAIDFCRLCIGSSRRTVG